MPKLNLADATLHFEIDGTGPPLMLIAGMASDSASWAPLVPLLRDHYTLIRPDNRSTGRTRPWDAPVSVPIYARDCAALLHHLGTGPAHVLGHSMGGMIGMQLAQMAPERVATLTLAASAPLRLSRNIALFKTLVEIRKSDAPPDTWLRAFFPWLFASSVYDVPGAVDDAAAAALAYPHAQSVEAMAHQLAALDGFDPAGLLPRCPTQALLANDDLLVPPALAQTVLRDTPTTVVANAGHSIHWDAPGAVALHLRRFTDDHPIEGAQ